MRDCYKGKARPGCSSLQSAPPTTYKVLPHLPRLSVLLYDHQIMSRTKEINTEPCKVCGVVIRYKGDIARHEQLHKPTDAIVMFKCPYEGCAYQTLQKSNLNTHIFTHTGEKPHACPDCDYRTADPGCLTRHRKRKHAYVPNRKTGKAKTSVGTKQSRRHTPYERKEVAQSPSPANLPKTLPEYLSTTMTTSDASCSEGHDNGFSYTWDKCLLPSEGTSFPLEPFTSDQFLPSDLSPAVDTCSQLFSGIDYSSDVMNLFSQFPQSICPAETYFTESVTFSSDEDLSWIFDPAMIQTASNIADRDGCYGTLESSSSLDFHSSPPYSVSSPDSKFYLSDRSIDSSSLFSPSPSPSGADYSFTEFLSSTSSFQSGLAISL
ncbi:Zinc finger protein [Termitomyces sp. J132]|nr:hypothetical protein H2248_012269 [Termitomyces sp. 'cryptogamus']KNZ80721.1 Zinc finger protein [Termitomyces sp. J132]